MKWPWQRDKKESQLSYFQRVDNFWSWWSENSSRILTSIDQDGGASIQPEISKQVSALYSGVGWVFGPPGSDTARHSFTITPEGCELDKYFVDFWHSKQPRLPEWTFYQSRQPADNFDSPFTIVIDGVSVSSESLWITPKVDQDNQEIDITAWSPTFAEIGEKAAWTYLFLLLDEALGEENTSRCLGSIDISSEQLNGAMLSVKSIALMNTKAISHVAIFSSEAPSGGEFAFIQLPTTLLPEDDPVFFRGEIEDQLDAQLGKQGIGKTVGGAMGQNAFYIDFVSFDKEATRSTISEVLTNLNYPFQIFSFVKP